MFLACVHFYMVTYIIDISSLCPHTQLPSTRQGSSLEHHQTVVVFPDALQRFTGQRWRTGARARLIGSWEIIRLAYLPHIITLLVLDAARGISQLSILFSFRKLLNFTFLCIPISDYKHHFLLQIIVGPRLRHLELEFYLSPFRSTTPWDSPSWLAQTFIFRTKKIHPKEPKNCVKWDGNGMSTVQSIILFFICDFDIFNSYFFPGRLRSLKKFSTWASSTCWLRTRTKRKCVFSLPFL